MFDFGLIDLYFCSIWLIGIACVFHVLIKYARKFVYVTVNCWFCNTNSKVSLVKKNEWHCMHCDQFNGFDEDGNYSKSIPEQFNENLNKNQYRFYSSSGKNLSKLNGLCRICNANQELKIRQLAVYEPFREENYDKEIELFKKRLEKSYKLCSTCEKTVQNTLELKSSIYAKVPDRTFREDEWKDSKFRVSKKKWFLICAVLFAFSILMAILWNYYPIKTDLFQTDMFINYFNADFTSVTQDYGYFINVLLIVCMTTFMRMKNPRGRIFGRPLLIGVLFYGIQDYLHLILKISAITLFFLHCIIKRWQKNKQSMDCTKLIDDFENRFMKHVDDEKSVSNNLYSLNSAIVSNPLCGKFSKLTLGNSAVASTSKNVPYLFKSTKSIIQPSRLKLDESERCDTPRSSRTTSSGYESVSNYLKRSTDSISEFDSVSQINDRSRNSPFELRSRVNQKTGSFLVTPPEQGFYNLGDDHNTISPYLYPRNLCFLPSEHYYGVSSTSTPKQSPPADNAFFSTIQIILCSLAFFVLGFSFQLFVNKLLS